MLVFLVGFMGSGKSTAGKMAAVKTGFEFIDLDTAIELKSGRSVTDIFKDEGQDFFRQQETATLHGLASLQKTVVAVGGGCACVNGNMEWMLNHGIVIYIKAHHGTLFHRLMPVKKDRPLIAALTDVELMEYIMNQLPVRETFYKRATCIVETGTEHPSGLSGRIVDAIHKTTDKISLQSA